MFSVLKPSMLLMLFLYDALSECFGKSTSEICQNVLDIIRISYTFPSLRFSMICWVDASVSLWILAVVSLDLNTLCSIILCHYQLAHNSPQKWTYIQELYSSDCLGRVRVLNPINNPQQHIMLRIKCWAWVLYSVTNKMGTVATLTVAHSWNSEESVEV